VDWYFSTGFDKHLCGSHVFLLSIEAVISSF
jgi:hypothetical protein